MGKKYEFLTNEPDLPTGMVAELYRRRWEAGKVFDGIKNKLGEKKAWATSFVVKETQAQLVAIAHNFFLLYEQTLETKHGVINAAEDQRRAKRTEAAGKKCAAAGQPLLAQFLRTPTGCPAQRQVCALEASVNPRSGCGSRRGAPPQGHLCHFIVLSNEHRSPAECR